MTAFHWYRINGDGSAARFDDTPAITALVNADGGSRWFASIEGAIRTGGVNATAFKRKTEMTYDAGGWLKTGAMVPMGEVTTTTITASMEG
jgi:hypothetical protein